MEKPRSIKELAVQGKRVLLCIDIPTTRKANKEPFDSLKLKQSLSSVQYLLKQGAAVVILPHAQAVQGDAFPSLAPLARKISVLLGTDALFFPSGAGREAEETIQNMTPGQVALLDNMFLYQGEESNDPSFASRLSRLGDLYVNDAFASSASQYASVSALPALFKEKAAGLIIENELKHYEQLFINTKKPLLCVMGGLKLSTRLDLMFSLAQKADKFIISGALSHTFLAAQGLQVGRSVFEKDMCGKALELLGILARRDSKVYAPVDFLVAPSRSALGLARAVPSLEIPADTMALDIGPASISLFQEVVHNADSIFWHGSLGVHENEEFSKGTQSIVEALSGSQGLTVACGKSAEHAISELELAHKFSLISSASESFCMLITGKKLPGLKALE